MNRSTDRILITHPGSLTRTSDIIEGMMARTLGEPIDEEQFQQRTATSIADVVRRQVDEGVDIPNDGEYARQAWNIYIEERIGGLETVELKPGEKSPFDRTGPERVRDQFPGFTAQYHGSAQFAWLPPDIDETKIAELRAKMGASRPICRLVEPLHHVDGPVQRDIANLRAALDDVEVADAFITAVTATNERQDVNVLDFYPSHEAYQYALADVMREEYKAITDSGFILQLDRPAVDATYALRNDEEILKMIDAAVEVENYALRGIPEDRVRLHWCQGSGNTPHTEDLPMHKVVKSMLKLNIGAYGFEAATPRHEHEWQLWEDVKLPDGKIIIPGIISQSTNVIEHPELIAWRIKNFARLVGRENVIAGVDCGFSQRWYLPRVHSEIQWAKLHSLAQGAAIASDELWKRPSTISV